MAYVTIWALQLCQWTVLINMFGTIFAQWSLSTAIRTRYRVHWALTVMLRLQFVYGVLVFLAVSTNTWFKGTVLPMIYDSSTIE